MIKVTHEMFIKKVKSQNPRFFEDGNLILDTYVGSTTKLTIMSEYGLCLINPNGLYRGTLPCIRNAVNNVEYFTNHLRKVNPDFFKQGFGILSKHIKQSTKILVSTPFGDCALDYVSLLAGCLPNIVSAINPHTFFVNKLNATNPTFLTKYNLLNKYTNSKNALYFMSFYGLYKLSPAHLFTNLKNSKIYELDIRNALDPTQYFINKLSQKHQNKFYKYTINSLYSIGLKQIG